MLWAFLLRHCILTMLPVGCWRIYIALLQHNTNSKLRHFLDSSLRLTAFSLAVKIDPILLHVIECIRRTLSTASVWELMTEFRCNILSYVRVSFVLYFWGRYLSLSCTLWPHLHSQFEGNVESTTENENVFEYENSCLFDVTRIKGKYAWTKQTQKKLKMQDGRCCWLPVCSTIYIHRRTCSVSCYDMTVPGPSSHMRICLSYNCLCHVNVRFTRLNRVVHAREVYLSTAYRACTTEGERYTHRPTYHVHFPSTFILFVFCLASGEHIHTCEWGRERENAEDEKIWWWNSTATEKGLFITVQSKFSKTDPKPKKCPTTARTWKN